MILWKVISSGSLGRSATAICRGHPPVNMGRPKGAKNKLTILREAHKARIDALREPEIIDSLHVLERSMRHFFIRAEMGMNAGRNQSEVDADYEKAAHLAALVAPYRHARLSAVKLAGDPNNSVPFKDGASVDELREEIMQDLGRLVSAGVIDLKALPVPDGGIANQPPPASINQGANGE
jgi:hypothetical protein